MTSTGRLACAALLVASASIHAAPVPPVYLNHLYVVLDASSYDAIQASPAIRALANVETTHVEASNGSWTGHYVMGRHTYIELFSGRQPPPDASEGDAGVGLQGEKAGGVEAAADALRPAFGERVKRDELKFKMDDGAMRKAYSVVELAPAKTPPGVELWVMEGDPGYVKARHPGQRVDDPLSRAAFSEHGYKPALPFEDVVGLRAALTPPQMAELAAQLRAMAWSVEERQGGFLAHGPDVALEAVPATGRSGLLEVTLRLSRAVPRQDVALGRARLQLEGLSGRLIFRSGD